MIDFRFMNETDLNDVIKIYERCFPLECGGKCENVKYRDGILLAIIDNNIVGMATIDYIFDNFLNEKIAYINNVCVDPKLQNNGIGKAIMNECERICKSNGCTKLQLTSTKKRLGAHKLYTTLGFYIYETTVFKKNI